MDSRDLGSWLSGPRAAAEAAGIDLGEPGERLGLPTTGSGSVAGWGRRLAALFIDWIASLMVAVAIPGLTMEDDRFGLAVLAVFAVEYLVLVSTLGYTLGMRIVGIGVAPVGRLTLPLWAVALRTLLLVLVIPAVVYDRDRRGLHDKAAGTVVLRR